MPKCPKCHKKIKNLDALITEDALYIFDRNGCTNDSEK